MSALERIVPVLQLLPYPLRPLVPLCLLAGTLTALLAAVAVAIVHLNSTRYHLTPWTGEPTLVIKDKFGRHGAVLAHTPAAMAGGRSDAFGDLAQGRLRAALGSDATRAE